MQGSNSLRIQHAPKRCQMGGARLIQTSERLCRRGSGVKFAQIQTMERCRRVRQRRQRTPVAQQDRNAGTRDHEEGALLQVKVQRPCVKRMRRRKSMLRRRCAQKRWKVGGRGGRSGQKRVEGWCVARTTRLARIQCTPLGASQNSSTSSKHKQHNLNKKAASAAAVKTAAPAVVLGLLGLRAL